MVMMMMMMMMLIIIIIIIIIVIIIISNSQKCYLSWKQQCFLLLVWSCPKTLDFKDLSQYGGRSKKCRLSHSSDSIWNSNSFMWPFQLFVITPRASIFFFIYLSIFFSGFVHFHTSRSKECWRASSILAKKAEVESSEEHWNITHRQSRFNRIGVEEDEKGTRRF